MPANEESVVGRKWRRVRALEHEMLGAVDVRAFLFGVIAPQYEYEVLAQVSKIFYRRIGKLLPPLPLVRARSAGTHRERRVQQENSLRGPARKVGVATHRVPEVRFELLENILERRRRRDARVDRKAQAIGLPRPVVRVLPEYDDLHRLERALVKCAENIFRSGVHRRFQVLLAYELREIFEVVLLKLAGEFLLPASADFHFSHACMLRQKPEKYSESPTADSRHMQVGTI